MEEKEVLFSAAHARGYMDCAKNIVEIINETNGSDPSKILCSIRDFLLQEMKHFGIDTKTE